MIFNVETGEVLEEDDQESLLSIPKHYLKPFVVQDVRNKEEFEAKVRDTVGKRKFRLWVSPLLPDLIVDRELTIAELGVFCFLAMNIGYGVASYSSTKELVDGTGYIRQTVYKALSVLEEKRFIKRMDNKLTSKEDRLYIVSPLYFYKGYYPNRENALKDWVMGS